MKKLLLLVAAITMFVGGAQAQRFEKNIFGIRGGLNVSNIRENGVSYDSKVGFHIGGSYERALTQSFPLYFETGLLFTWKGCQFNNDDDYASKVNAAYLEIPLMLNYKFNIHNKVTLYPSAGFYYALGLGGNFKSHGGKIDTFGNQDFQFQRSDFGMRFGGSVVWRQFVFGLGYEFSLIDVCQHQNKYYGDVKPNNFFLSVGYNF